MMIDPQGDQSEVVIYEKALRELLLGDQIELGLTSIPFGNQPLSKDEALSELDKLVPNYRFNETRNLWNERGALVVFAGPCRDGINERYQLFMTRLLQLRQDPISEF